MSWSPIIKDEIGEGVPCVRVGASRRSGRATFGQIVVHLSASLAAFIRVRPGDRISLEIGKLADDGWMRISQGKDLKASRHGHRGSIRVRFSGRRLGVVDPHSPEVVKYMKGTVGGTPCINFMLPKWARLEETVGPQHEDEE